jgi:hypothetical protein
MTHKIFGYKGFVVKVIPREVIAMRSAANKRINYAASVVIMRFMGASRHKDEMRCYPSGTCVTPEQALKLGTEYATQLIDDDFSNTALAEQF